jgi:arylsulfatase A-like enzyme
MRLAPLLLLAALFTAAISTPTSAAAQSTPPNIVFIMADQMRADFLGCAGNEAVHSPNLDRFASEGAHFRRAYASTPSCTPARAAILTGQSPWSHGMIGYNQVAERYPVELPRLMNEAGYFTHAIGKQHFHPQRNTHGYQGMELDECGRRRDPGFISDYHTWFTDVLSNRYDPDATGLGWNDYRAKSYRWQDEVHPTAWTGERATEFLREYDRDQPFFLKVSFARPHSPYDPPQTFLGQVDPKTVPAHAVGDWSEQKFGHFHQPEKFSAARNNLGDEITRAARRAYAANIAFIDEQIGDILSVLEERDMLKNTLLVFTSDHGDMLGDHHLWRKTYAYEGSAGVPMLMLWGDDVMRAPRGQVRNELVELRDLLPTFLDVAGAPVPESVEGLSMLHPVKGLRTAWRQWLDLEHATCYWPGNNWTALTDSQWKYIFHAHDGSEQLFDLKADPQELVDLSAEENHQDMLAVWRTRMAEHLEPRGEEWVKDGAPAVRKKGETRSPNYPGYVQQEVKQSKVKTSPKSVSGIYPHLTFFNDENECGTGALVPWANRLWAITYAPHAPRGSSDKLYEITPELELIVRPESIGGTPANRMIHDESQQLFIGPYAIDQSAKVRVIPWEQMLGRLTGNARHLTDPANKIYYATMEEGLYEVDVHTLEVTNLYGDTHRNGPGPDPSPNALRNDPTPLSNLPGYHGKGLYSGQGRVIYSNNGEKGPEVFTNPFTPSGALAEWMNGEWNVVMRNQFTEVTGPGGIHGNADPANDPIWSMGWDARSLILMLLDDGEWHRFRLPKASHSYDGAHGWNTEWPRIRDIGEEDLLMTMHGMFWRFPRTFSANNTAGIAPRSSYLKVVGDFCRWQDRIVFGCDDTAKSEFENKRKAKGVIAAPQSQSNLWFVEPEQLDDIGPIFARGAVWLKDAVKADQPSDPMLVHGFERRSMHLVTDKPTKIYVEADMTGRGDWAVVDTIRADGYQWKRLTLSPKVQWVRLRSDQDLTMATAIFNLDNPPESSALSPFEMEGPENPGLPFEGMSLLNDPEVTGGVIRARGDNQRTLHFAARNPSNQLGHYVLDENLNLRADGDEVAFEWLQENAAIPSRTGVIGEDSASLYYIDNDGQRYRLPSNLQNQPFLLNTDVHPAGYALGNGRLCREVATERDLFHLDGIFYELPADNAGGFSKIRPISSHQMQVNDFCSYRGMMVMSGVNLKRAAAVDNPNIVVSEDGKVALWVGAVDDLWKLGKPRGSANLWPYGGVKANEPSDPMLFNGFDEKWMVFHSNVDCKVTLELDITGDGDWQPYQEMAVSAGEGNRLVFPSDLHAYWVRARVDRDADVACNVYFE